MTKSFYAYLHDALRIVHDTHVDNITNAYDKHDVNNVLMTTRDDVQQSIALIDRAFDVDNVLHDTSIDVESINMMHDVDAFASYDDVRRMIDVARELLLLSIESRHEHIVNVVNMIVYAFRIAHTG